MRTSRDASSSAFSHRCRREAVHSVERPQRVQPCPWIGCARRQTRQRRHDGHVLALDEQPLGRVAAPSVRMRECLHKGRGGSGGHRRLRVAACGVVHDAVDAAVADRLLEAVRHDVIAQVLGDEPAVLDDAAIHVHEIQRPVRRVREVDGPEALVGRCKELRAVVSFLRLDRRAVVVQHNPAHHVRRGLDDEDIAVEFPRQTIAAVHQRRGDGRKVREGPVGPQDAALVAAIHSRRWMRRPHGVDFVRVTLE